MSETRIFYQNQHLPGHIVEQIQLAVQNGIAIDPQLHNIIFKQQMQQITTVDSQERNIVIVNHRDNSNYDSENDVHRNRQATHNQRVDIMMSNGMHDRISPVTVSNPSSSPMIIPNHSTSHMMLPDNFHSISERTASLIESRLSQERQAQARLFHEQASSITHGQQKIQINHLSTSNNQGDCESKPMSNGRIVLLSENTPPLPLSLQIKSERDPEDSPYFYEQMLQAYSGNGNLQIDNSMLLPVNGLLPQSTPVQYVFNGQSSLIPPLFDVDKFGRQQLFQSYPDEDCNNSENHAERQPSFDRMKKESISHKIENINMSEQNNFYSNEQWDKSENDAGAHNKLPNPNGVDYKGFIEARYGNIKGEYVCVKCNGVFPSKRSLKQHTKNCLDEASADKTGRLSCSRCSYRCQSPAILKIHERTHTGEKPFSCTFCDYKSGQKNNVSKHILVHMKEKPFHCQYCDYRCAQKNNLVVHERTHTGFKPFACTLCDYKTVQKPNLVKHMYLHTGQKPYSCDICSYRCVQKTNLTKHKLRHLNEKPGEAHAGSPYRPRHKTYNCDLCSFSCVQKQGLDQHVKFSHQNDPSPDGQSHKTGLCSPIGLQIIDQSSIDAQSQSDGTRAVLVDQTLAEFVPESLNSHCDDTDSPSDPIK